MSRITDPTNGKTIYRVFATDTNSYAPFRMWLEDGGSLSIDIYDDNRPVGHVSIRIENEVLTIDTTAEVPPRSEYTGEETD